MSVDDSRWLFFSFKRMIVRDSFSVSCFGNHKRDSSQYFIKFPCKRQCPLFAIGSPISRFYFSFWSIPLSVLSSTNTLQIHLPYISTTNRLSVNKLPLSFVAKNSYFHKFVSRDAILVFTFLRWKSLELAALWGCSRDCCWTIVKYRQQCACYFPPWSRSSLAVSPLKNDSWW